MSVKSKFYEARCQKAVKALIKNGFDAIYVPTKEEAVKKALDLVPPNAKVGVGGSVTIRELGIVDELKARGHELFDHYLADTPDEKNRMRKGQLTCDVFFSSTNALTLDGKLVNIDGTGNRVASMIFGPGHVVLIVGANKITDDLQQAMIRAKHLAAPMNAMRLNLKTPCATTGYCSDCNSEDRICKVTTIIEYKPDLTNFTVILVGEEIGY
ncbi:MAG: lactate utilization protein [Tepidanaerobacteraceae bacterium]|jgi:L-lactate utilization protein LutB|nr:lactate utilization protein [Tepidanaerobacter sp.]HQA60885.1 lactate utilization protein [Tepidanaerobacteraceae bacterium]HQE05409.1 lactate utilization protein [Tepidanaerobacteraceae bacterium]